mgnify:CR=1 FL=1
MGNRRHKSEGILTNLTQWVRTNLNQLSRTASNIILTIKHDTPNRMTNSCIVFRGLSAI